jgi:putative ABC transport system substrate-binding protein
MDRREFLAISGLGILLAAPRGWSQQPQPQYRVAFVEAGSASANQHFVDAFMVGLRDLHYVPGNNILIDVRWAEGRAEGFRIALAELLKLRPDVVVVSSALGAVEARRASTSIPVVFIGVSEPVDIGLAKSLGRPGGNLTGLARAAGESLDGKIVQTLREIAPGITRVAILWNPNAAIGLRRTQAVTAVEALGMTALVIEVRDRDGFGPAFEMMSKQRANALFVITDPLTLASRKEIVNLALATRIPAIYEFDEFARAGGLVAYAPSIEEQFQRAAIYVDKILRGAKPGDLPIEQPTKFELVINLATAKQLGIVVPKEMLLRADEVIH